MTFWEFAAQTGCEIVEGYFCGWGEIFDANGEPAVFPL